VRFAAASVFGAKPARSTKVLVNQAWQIDRLAYKFVSLRSGNPAMPDRQLPGAESRR